MKALGSTYYNKVVIVLLALRLWLGGTPALWAQAPTTELDTSFAYPTATDSLRYAQVSDSLLKTMPVVPAKRFIPDPNRALWLSLVLPGAGQIYNRKYWKLPIVYGGFLGCIYAYSWNSQMYNDYSRAYLDLMDDNPHTCSYVGMLPLGYDITGREERFKVIFKNKKDYFRKYRDMSIFAFVGVYLLSVVDAYVDAKLSSFDISEDLSLEVAPTLIPHQDKRSLQRRESSVGVQCNLNF